MWKPLAKVRMVTAVCVRESRAATFRELQKFPGIPDATLFSGVFPEIPGRLVGMIFPLVPLSTAW